MLKAAAVPVALLASGALVFQSSSAAFSATTSNPANSWASGSVALTDDDGGTSPTTGTAMFTATRLKPGSTGTKCIVVTSQGTVASTLKLYASGVATTQAMSTYLNLNVEEGAGGSFGSCTGFTSASTTFTGTLAAFAAKADYATAVGAYPLTGTPPETRSYRITYTLDAATPNTVQGGTAAATFVWETQS